MREDSTRGWRLGACVLERRQACRVSLLTDSGDAHETCAGGQNRQGAHFHRKIHILGAPKSGLGASSRATDVAGDLVSWTREVPGCRRHLPWLPFLASRHSALKQHTSSLDERPRRERHIFPRCVCVHGLRCLATTTVSMAERGSDFASFVQ